MKRFLLIFALCASAHAQDASYLEYKLVTEGRLIELSQLHELQAQKRELQKQVESLQPAAIEAARTAAQEAEEFKRRTFEAHEAGF